MTEEDVVVLGEQTGRGGCPRIGSGCIGEIEELGAGFVAKGDQVGAKGLEHRPEIVVVDPPNPMELPRPPFPVTPFLDPITDAELAAHGGLKRSIVMRALANPWPGVPGTAAPITDPPARFIVHPGDELNDWVYNTGNSTVADNVYAIGSPATTSSPAPVTPPTTFTHPDTYIPFQSTRALTQTVALDSVEEWTVFSMNNVRHPFHIHVNPMYVVKVKDKSKARDQWDIFDLVETVPDAKGSLELIQPTQTENPCSMPPV